MIQPWSPEAVSGMVSALATMSRAEARSTYLKQNAGLVAARLAVIAVERRESAI